MRRRSALPSLLAIAVSGSLLVACGMNRDTDSELPDAANPARAVAYRDVQWQELSPKEWDPTQLLQGEGGNLLNDADPRAEAMLDELRALWDSAPIVSDLDGAAIRLAGYVVPLDAAGGKLTAFLLVPYFGACIHTPPPPANQIVHVVPREPVAGFQAMDTVCVSGRMATQRQDSPMGASGYRLEAAQVEAYRPPRGP